MAFRYWRFLFLLDGVLMIFWITFAFTINLSENYPLNGQNFDYLYRNEVSLGVDTIDNVSFDAMILV